MLKGYTLNYFIKTMSSATNSQVAKNGIYNVISPRNGESSVKVEALNSFLHNLTDSVVEGKGRFSTYGKTPRARLLKALRVRKQTGLV